MPFEQWKALQKPEDAKATWKHIIHSATRLRGPKIIRLQTALFFAAGGSGKRFVVDRTRKGADQPPDNTRSKLRVKNTTAEKGPIGEADQK